MQVNNTTSWAKVGIYIVQQGINLRPSRAKAGYSAKQAFFGKTNGMGPADMLDENVTKACLTEAGLQAALEFVQREEHTTADHTSSNFNDRIIEEIRKADAAHAAKEDQKMPASADEPAESARAEQKMGPAKVDAVPGTMVEGDINEAATTKEKEPVTEQAPTPTKTSAHHSSDTPERGEIRAAIAAAQRKQAEAVNRKRMSGDYIIHLKEGDICRVQVEGNTRAATDHPTVPVVVTKCDHSQERNHYQIASRDGHLKGWYPRENLEYEAMWDTEMAGIDISKEGFKNNLSIANASMFDDDDHWKKSYGDFRLTENFRDCFVLHQ